MKLDKWPEEIECAGWRWKKHDEKHPCGVFYAMSKKTYTPPTMREIMEHLLKGGWVRYADYSNADYYYRMKSDGELEYSFKRHDSKAEEWKETGFSSRFKGSFDKFHLIDPYEWFKGEEK